MPGTTTNSVVEIIAIGDDLGIALPDWVIQDFGLEIGDHLAVGETPRGSELKPVDTAETHALERVMRENHDVLKRLAES
jgi:hypothetical protein